jgi:hypothetical protein
MKITKQQLKQIIKEEIEQGLKEAGYFTTNMPDDVPSTADIMQKMRDDGTAPEEESRDLAGAFNVKVSVEVASDGQPALTVKHEDGEVAVYNNSEEMYQDLVKRGGY